ncbi:tRNA pseudouridine synthase [Basidiobolus meristosporus CBS 931.73]|uniref:tRNA pseudouridine synthase 1 n=1 Tax=Basidiobolus meristosporus CBS 931.73 TaxID=1314790 RepID=A0A1Y1Y1Y5_9FUNG|nr:tRNA pseudouridine synthase [Basidiobolus meristosporus CBS 931.73]|eukprot:ORX92021.1 tRNA pseudouridine synthase [Basidiobolus meristosporus CBS 931.73]
MLFTARHFSRQFSESARLAWLKPSCTRGGLAFPTHCIKREYTNEPAEVEAPQRLPKRKVALLLSYCGAGYQGMQHNPNAKTIEGELFKALVAAGAVSKENSSDQNKVSLMRAARTDKGVHAVGQVVSLKMIVGDEIVPRINSYLPDHIRVWDYVRVSKSFNPKNFCDSRVYSYLLPTHILAQASFNHSSEYRVPPEKVDFLRTLCSKFTGTHSFHNFTIGKSFTDSSVKRYITKFECSEPRIIAGFEWVNFQIQGQSFMLHQIRKMIGLMILMTRANSPSSLVDDSFLERKLNIPKAPGISLVLERPVFSAYNKLALTQGKSPIDFSQHKNQIDKFKSDHIDSSVTALAIQNDSFDQWIKSLYTFPESFDYL